MIIPGKPIADSLSPLAENVGTPLKVSLSDQLYQSPLKAIEELVVNAYDADANECRIFVPEPDDLSHRFVVVYDDGIGM